MIETKEMRRRREALYYMSLGMLGYQETKRECASIAELSESCGVPPDRAERVVRGMVRRHEIEPCPTHKGFYRVGPKLLEKYGLKP